MEYFQTDKSGATWHKMAEGVRIVARCGVTNENTQWTRQSSTVPAKVCPRC